MDNDNYYRLDLDALPLDAELFKIEQGAHTSVATSSYNQGGQYSVNVIKVRNSGTSVSIFVNGDEVFNDLHIVSDSGKIGLHVAFNPVQFDNIEVLKGGFSAPDTIAPTVPTNLAMLNKTETSFDLSWTASTDGAGIAGYRVYKDDNLEKVVTTNSATVNGLSCGTSYEFFVTAIDSSGLTSGSSTVESFSTIACSDITPPAAPTNLAVSNIEQYSMDLSWTAPASEDVFAYHIYKNEVFETAFLGTSGTISGLNCETSYDFMIKAADTSGNLSEATSAVSEMTSECPDVTPPTVPQNLDSANVARTSFDLSWAASSDDVGVTAYVVYLDGDSILTISGTTASITGLHCDSTYRFKVIARDSSGNVSDTSKVLPVTTATCPLNMNEVFSNKTVRVFPVPFQNTLNIRFNNIKGPCRLKLMNTLGQVVYTGHLQINNEKRIVINEALQKGIYVLQIQMGNALYNQKVVRK